MGNGNHGDSLAKVRGRWKSAKHALAETIHRSSQSIEAIAIDLGRSYSTVQKWGDIHEPDAFPPAHLLPKLLKAADNPAYLDYLEDGINRVAFTLPKGDTASVRQVAEMAIRFGEMLKQVVDGDADGQRTAPEVTGVLNAGTALIASVAAVMDDWKRTEVPERNTVALRVAGTIGS